MESLLWELLIWWWRSAMGLAGRLLDSPFAIAFATALVGSLAGAFGGAAAAQRIAERGKRRDELVREIRNTNAAISLAADICGAMLKAKKDHVKGLKESYDAQRKLAVEFDQMLQAGQLPPSAQPFPVDMDLKKLITPALKTDTLQEIVFERISVIGRPLRLLSALARTAENVHESISARNALIEEFKELAAANAHQEVTRRYLGLPGVNHVDLTYKQTLDAIYVQTDSCIFFGDRLWKDLHEHGQKLLTELKKLTKRSLPRISHFDFSESKAEGLWPDEKDYQDWFTKFKTGDTEKKPEAGDKIQPPPPSPE